MTQRNGRIIRQGNRNKEVQVYQYVTEGTFDAYLYQTLENKQKFISQIFNFLVESCAEHFSLYITRSLAVLPEQNDERAFSVFGPAFPNRQKRVYR